MRHFDKTQSNFVRSSENRTEFEDEYDSGTIARLEKLFPAGTSICFGIDRPIDFWIAALCASRLVAPNLAYRQS
jgi:hypothetical protein